MWIDLSQAMDRLVLMMVACLFMCRCYMRLDMVDDSTKT